MFKIMKLIICLSLCLVSGSIYATGQTLAPTDMQKLITGDQVLKVGHVNYAPFYVHNNGHLTGLDVEAVKEAAKRARIKKVIFVEYDNLQKLIADLDQGKINLIATGILSTPERNQKYLLTIPYYRGGGIGFLYLAGQNNFKTLKDLQGLKIGITNYSYPQLWLSQHGISGGNINVYPTVQAMIQALKERKIDIIINNYTFCRYEAAMNKQMISYLVQPMNVVFMMRKQDNALQQSLNKALLSMWKDGSLYAIKVKYLVPIGVQPQKHYSTVISKGRGA